MTLESQSHGTGCHQCPSLTTPFSCLLPRTQPQMKLSEPTTAPSHVRGAGGTPTQFDPTASALNAWPHLLTWPDCCLDLFLT